MRNKGALLALGMLVWTGATAQVTYRCQAEDGRAIFTDRGCPAGMRQISPPPGPSLSDQVEQRQQATAAAAAVPERAWFFLINDHVVSACQETDRTTPAAIEGWAAGTLQGCSSMQDRQGTITTTCKDNVGNTTLLFTAGERPLCESLRTNMRALLSGR